MHSDIILEDSADDAASYSCKEDKETNTECVFLPEKGSKGGVQHIIKRSQTFSPTATNQYICRVILLIVSLGLISQLSDYLVSCSRFSFIEVR